MRLSVRSLRRRGLAFSFSIFNSVKGDTDVARGMIHHVEQPLAQLWKFGVGGVVDEVLNMDAVLRQVRKVARSVVNKHALGEVAPHLVQVLQVATIGEVADVLAVEAVSN